MSEFEKERAEFEKWIRGRGDPPPKTARMPAPAEGGHFEMVDGTIHLVGWRDRARFMAVRGQAKKTLDPAGLRRPQTRGSWTVRSYGD